MSKIFIKSSLLDHFINGELQTVVDRTLAELAHLREMIDENTTLDEYIAIWSSHVKALKTIKEIVPVEMDARKILFARAFPTPKENTNTVELGKGWKLKAIHKLDRTIDEATLPEVMAELKKMDVNTDVLIKYEPRLELAIYRTLTAEVLEVFNQAITTKPGSPQMELVAPKEKK